MSNLKPCPFCGYELPFSEGLCGGEVLKITSRGDSAETIIEPFGICCSNCGAYTVGGATKDTAIQAWNTRAPTEANARADLLKRLLTDWVGWFEMHGVAAIGPGRLFEDTLDALEEKTHE